MFWSSPVSRAGFNNVLVLLLSFCILLHWSGLNIVQAWKTKAPPCIGSWTALKLWSQRHDHPNSHLEIFEGIHIIHNFWRNPHHPKLPLENETHTQHRIALPSLLADTSELWCFVSADGIWAADTVGCIWCGPRNCQGEGTQWLFDVARALFSERMWKILIIVKPYDPSTSLNTFADVIQWSYVFFSTKAHLKFHFSIGMHSEVGWSWTAGGRSNMA